VQFKHSQSRELFREPFFTIAAPRCGMALPKVVPLIPSRPLARASYLIDHMIVLVQGTSSGLTGAECPAVHGKVRRQDPGQRWLARWPQWQGSGNPRSGCRHC
jgi:hypothetical protein